MRLRLSSQRKAESHGEERSEAERESERERERETLTGSVLFHACDFGAQRTFKL